MIELILPSGNRYRLAAWQYSDLLAKATPPGARWITVHPNGKDEKGVPVLIEETQHGSGVYHVVGGAGGKLNYLKLRGVKSEGEYRQAASERAKARSLDRAEQRIKDKKAGIYEQKQQAKKEIRGQRAAHETNFVTQVAEAMGWKPEEVAFDEAAHQNLSDKALAKLRNKHHDELLKRANEVVEQQRERLLADADARAEGLGEVPLESSDASVISTQDLDPMPERNGSLGYQKDYKGRAEARGLTEDDLQAQTADLQKKRASTYSDEKRQAIENRKVTSEQIARELQGIRDPAPESKTKLVDAKKAVELLKAQKALKQIQKKARDLVSKVESAEEPKAYVLEVGTAELDISADLENDLRTIRTRAFLSEVAKTGTNYEKALAKHIGVGAYNALNSVALTAGGASLVDRGVVDVLGIAGAAQVLSRRLHNDLTPDEVSELTDALSSYHVDHYMKASEESLREAMEWQQVASEIDVGQAHDGRDLAAAQELNAKRRDAITNAQRALGTALGEMETNAALLVALKQGAKDSIEVSMGKVSDKSAIEQAYAIGLDKGDFTINEVEGNKFITVTGAGMDKLAQPVSREDLEATRTALDIIEGRQDEKGWLPGGIARRPDLAAKPEPGAAPSLAEPFTPGEDLGQSIQDYIGGRTADGDTPADIIADLLSQDLAERSGDRKAYFEQISKLVPLRDADGKMIRAESYQDAFEKMADAFVQSRYGEDRQPLHRQAVPVDQVSVDALHRALAAEPTGTVAFKPVGDLTPQDQLALRRYFEKAIAKDDPKAAALAEKLSEHDRAEPQKQSVDMFGESSTSPEWTQWRNERDRIASDANAATLTWSKYVEAMGNKPEEAYATMQDMVRSQVTGAFHAAYNTLRPDAPLKLGRTTLRNNLAHLDATDHDARERRLAEARELADSLRNRNEGRYAAGSVREKMDSAREQQEAMRQSQIGFFGASEEGASKEKPLASDERYTLGHAAERAIAGMMGQVGQNFTPGKPLRLWQLGMDGKYIGQQRAVKLIQHNKRLALAQGVGSGKTTIGLGAFTHLHKQGLAKKGLFLVPSIVQGQFAGESLRYLEAGKYKWHAEPGASRESRIAAYKDPETHFSVVTHQSFRDDMLHLAAARDKTTPQDIADKLDAMKPDERTAYMKQLMADEGINADYMMVDEGHDLLNRAGKQNSRLANVVDSVSANLPYYVSASADPVKNDTSEFYDLLHKMAPDRYKDRDAFMRKYGVDTDASRESMRRELVRYVYPGRIESGMPVHKKEEKVELSEQQHAALQHMDTMLARARMARMKGTVDVEAAKALSPASFNGQSEEQAKALAKRIQDSLGVVKETAVRRILDEHPDGAKLSKIAELVKARPGKPGVIFSRSLSSVGAIAEQLRAAGHRVVTITGADSSKEKERKRLAFRPEHGEATADILVCSDAGAVGLNAQRGQWLIQYDTPMTAKTHEQRNGRIDRLGQKNEVELIDLVADHPSERENRDRLARKMRLREVLTSPLEGLDDTGLAHYLNEVRASRQQAQQFKEAA